ncbi:MAG: hypothetical protein VB064_08290 [Oscillospiraceae bacterium]|nr:hypothetical protein [Oscillospiraceae bacterium]
MKKRLSIILAMLMVVSMFASTTAYAMMDSINYDSQTIEPYASYVGGYHVYDDVPWGVTTRTVQPDGNMTVKLNYNLISGRDTTSPYVDSRFTDAYFTMNNISCENEDGVLFSNGPVTVNFYGGNWNYGNNRGITQFTNYAIHHGELLYLKASTLDYSTYYSNVLLSTGPTNAGEGVDPTTNTVTLTEPGYYMIKMSTTSTNVRFDRDFRKFVCILDSDDDMNYNLPQTVTATPNNANISVNGTSYNCPAYLINGNNYIKIRDIAMMLKGTSKDFNVTYMWGQVNLRDNNGESYEVLGSELTPIGNTVKTATLSTMPFMSTAIAEVKPLAYIIDGSNYVMLRHIGMIEDFGVSYDSTTGTISIDTSTGYSE